MSGLAEGVPRSVGWDDDVIQGACGDSRRRFKQVFGRRRRVPVTKANLAAFVGDNEVNADHLVHWVDGVLVGDAADAWYRATVDDSGWTVTGDPEAVVDLAWAYLTGVEPGRTQRLVAANDLLQTIASLGRRFFHYQGRVGQLDVDGRGRVWYVDPYAGRRVFTHYRGEWRGFSSGGTMRGLVRALRDFVKDGTQIREPRGPLGPWPAWYGSGDLWGYGDDMDAVRTRARELGILPAVPDQDAAKLMEDGS